MSDPCSPSGDDSVMAVLSSSPESHAGSMNRLVLPKKQLLVGEKKFLPQGDALPKWYNMSLVQKLPMFPSPQGAVQLTTTKMGKRIFTNPGRVDFDLTDPYNYCINTTYKCVNDPHMIYYLSMPKHKKRLIKLGELTPDCKATATLQEYNQYRRWLKHVGLQEFRKQQLEERDKLRNMKKMDPGDNLEIAVIELQIHQEEVRQRQFQKDEVQQIKVRDQLLEMERRLEAAKNQREERNAPDSEHNRAKKAHRSLVYTRATSLQRKRERQKLRAYKKKLRDHLEYLKEVEAQRVDNSAEKILEGWKRQKEYQRNYEDDVRASYEKEEDRASRYRKLFDAEMNRRWQHQAGQLKKRKDEAREKTKDLEETYSRNLAKAFAGSPIINPKGYKNVPPMDTPPLTMQVVKAAPGEEIDETKADEEENEALDELPALEFPKRISGDLPKRISGELPKTISGESHKRVSVELPKRLSGDRVPTLKSVHSDSSRTLKSTSLSLETPLQEMNVNVRLHDLKDQKSLEEMNKIKGAYSHIVNQVSGESLIHFPGLKKKPEHRRPQAVSALSYPTKTKVIGPDDQPPSPGEEVGIYMPYELHLQNKPDMPEDKHESEHRLEHEDSLFGDALPGISRRATMCDNLNPEDREAMEQLLARLLNDLNKGHLDQNDLVKLASVCAALTESELIEQATSTTSLDYVPRIKSSESEQDKKTPDSSTSDLYRYIGETVDKAYRYGSEQEDLFGENFVEDTIKNTFRQLTEDLEDGTLSKAEVREIGSAVASAVMGEVRSDTSIMADAMMVPTLEQLVRDAESIDEVLLDQTMASLLSSYNRVSRRQDKMVWQVLKDFVVEVLLRTKGGMIKGMVDIPNFIDLMEKCKVTPLHFEMELPCHHEFLVVMTEAISKLASVHRLSPVVCELMKIILEQGQPILIQRHGAENLSLPQISSSMLDQVGESACGLEVALEVATTVADGLYREMLMEAKFEELLQGTLAPAFLFTVLTCWGEMVAGVPKDTVALQTSSKEIAYTTTVAENVILLAFNGVMKDAINGRLSSSFVSHVALHISEFPALMPISTVFEHNADGKVEIPPYVMNKIVKLGQNVFDGSLSYDETKKLLAVVLNIYIREVLLRGDCALPSVSLVDETGMRSTISYLISKVAKHAQECVLTQVIHKLSMEDITNTAIEVSLVTDIVQLMADNALLDVEQTATQGVRPSDSGENQLNDIIVSIVRTDESAAEQPQTLEPTDFLSRVAMAVKLAPNRQAHRPSVFDGESFHTVGVLIRKELGKMAKDIARMFTGMAVLHQQMYKEPCPLVHKMMTFVIAILMELRNALVFDVLSPARTFDFLHNVAPDLCVANTKPSVRALESVVMKIVQDVEWKKEKSAYFGRIVRNLSKLTLEKEEKEGVAQSMATTAYMLSTVDPTILNQFVQTTLMSLLNSIRRLSKATAQPTTEVGTPDSTEDRRFTPRSSAGSRGSLPTDAKGGSPDESKDDQDSSRKTGEGEESKEEGSISTDENRESQLRDVLNERELQIRYEASLIAHIAIQNTLDRVEAQPSHPVGLNTNFSGTTPTTTAPTRSELSDDSIVGEVIVTDISQVASKMKAKPNAPFTDLDPTMASYAQKLLQDVVKYMETEDNDEYIDDETMSAEVVGGIIISNTFSSIEQGLQSGKFRLPTGTNEGKEEEWTTSLSVYISTTLNAVLDQLDLLQKEFEEEEPVQLKESLSDEDIDTDQERHEPSSASVASDPLMVKKAKKIVDFLIHRVNLDTGQPEPGETKVEFQITKTRRLSVSDSIGVPTVPQNPFKTTVLETFRDVLKEMHDQNQFFNPDNASSKATSRQSQVIPCLTYLLDEFILNEIQHIGDMLFNKTLKQGPALDPLSKEAIVVAVSFYDVILEIQELETSKDTANSGSNSTREQAQTKRRSDALRILSEALKEILVESGANLELLVECLHKVRRVSSSVDEVIPDSSTSKSSVRRSSSHTKSDLNRLMDSLTDVRDSSKRKVSSRLEVLTENLKIRAECVMQAAYQILSSIQDDQLTEGELNDLCKILLKNQSLLDSPEVKRQRLCDELSSLVDSIADGSVPANKLEQAAVELAELQKKCVNEPAMVAQAVKRVSFGIQGHGVGPEYLKVAVTELLKGVKESSDPIDSVELNDRGRQQSIFTRPSAIDNRTVSRMYISFGGENRENSMKSIYSVHVDPVSGAETADDEEDASGSLSYSSSHTLTLDVPQFPQVNEIDPGDGIEDPGDRIEDPGDGIVDPGHGIEDPGHGIEDPGDRIEDPGDGIVDPGHGIEDPGDKIEDPTEKGDPVTEKRDSKSNVRETTEELTQNEEDIADLAKEEEQVEEQLEENIGPGVSSCDSPTRGSSCTAVTVSGIVSLQESWDIMSPKFNLVTPGTSWTAMTPETPASVQGSWASVDNRGTLAKLPMAIRQLSEPQTTAGAQCEEKEDAEEEGGTASPTGDVQIGFSNPPTPGGQSTEEIEGEESGTAISLTTATTEGQSSYEDLNEPGEEDKKENEVSLARTSSESSKESDSKASLEASSEDFNRSAVRVTRRSYTSRIDEVQGFEDSSSSTSTPILVRPARRPPGEMDPEKRKAYFHTCRYHKHIKPAEAVANKTENACSDVSAAKKHCLRRMRHWASAEKRNKTPSDDNTAQGETTSTAEEHVKTESNTRVDWESAESVHEYFSQAGPSNGALGDAELSCSSLTVSQTQERTETGDMVSLRSSSSVLSHRQFSISLQKPRKADASRSGSGAPPGSRGFISMRQTSSSIQRVGKLDDRTTSRHRSRTTNLQELRVGLDPYLQTQSEMPHQYSYLPLDPREERAQRMAFAAGRKMFNQKEKEKRWERQKQADMKMFYKAVDASLDEKATQEDPAQFAHTEGVPVILVRSDKNTNVALRARVNPTFVPHPPSGKRKSRESTSTMEELGQGGPPRQYHAVPHPPTSGRKNTETEKVVETIAKGFWGDGAIVQTNLHSTGSGIMRPTKLSAGKETEKTNLIRTTVPRRVRVCSPSGFKMEAKPNEKGSAKTFYPQPPTGKDADASCKESGSAASVGVSSSAGRVIRRPSFTKSSLMRNAVEEIKNGCHSVPRPPTVPRDTLGSRARYNKSDFSLLLADSCTARKSDIKQRRIEESRPGPVQRSFMRGLSSSSDLSSSRGGRFRHLEISLATEQPYEKKSPSQRPARLLHPSTSGAQSWLTGGATRPRESRVFASTSSGARCQRATGPQSQLMNGTQSTERISSQLVAVPDAAEFKLSSIRDDGLGILPYFPKTNGGSSQAHGRRQMRRLLPKDEIYSTVIPGAVAS